MKSGVMPWPAVWSGVPCRSAPRSTGGAAMEVQDRSAPRPEIVELAARLAPTLAARAAAFDEADAFAGEDFDDLVASGYTAMTVPSDLGGMGAGALDLVAAQSRLAEGSPATALAANMHLHGVGILAETLRHRVEPFLKQVVSDGAILAGGFSEPESGGNWWYQATTAVPLAGGGWRLQGVKRFFTGFPRATGSHAIAVDDLEVSPDCLVDQGFGVAASFLLASHWSWPSFASVFLGAAEAAYRYVVDTLPGRRNEGLGRSLAELPGVHQAVGEMRMRLDGARAALYAAVSRPPDPDPTAHYGRMAGAKLFTCQTALEVCTIALRTAGGSGYLRTAPLERLLRDAHAGLLLPPSHDATLQWIGRVELGAGGGP